MTGQVKCQTIYTEGLKRSNWRFSFVHMLHTSLKFYHRVTFDINCINHGDNRLNFPSKIEFSKCFKFDSFLSAF